MEEVQQVQHCIPQLKALKPQSSGTLESMIWTQNGAAPHRRKEVLAYLNRQFGDHQFNLGSKVAPEFLRLNSIKKCPFMLRSGHRDPRIN